MELHELLCGRRVCPRLRVGAAPLAVSVSAGSWVGPPGRPCRRRPGALGALLALIAGWAVPAWPGPERLAFRVGLAAVHPRFKVPNAPLVLAAVIWLIVSIADRWGAIGFSSFGVLIDYLVANLAAFTQTGENRRYPKGMQVLGAIACGALTVTLPVGSVIAGLPMYAAGILYRILRLRFERAPRPQRRATGSFLARQSYEGPLTTRGRLRSHAATPRPTR